MVEAWHGACLECQTLSELLDGCLLLFLENFQSFYQERNKEEIIELSALGYFEL